MGSRRLRTAKRPARGGISRTAKIVVVIFALAGAGLAARGAYRAWRHRWLLDRVRRAYVAAECTVTAKDVRISMHIGRAHGRGRRRDTHAVFEPLVRYRYRVGSRWLESDRFSPDPPIEHQRERIGELLKRYDVGRSYRCWYDPERPDQAVLERP